jgi:hypothetical protein
VSYVMNEPLAIDRDLAEWVCQLMKQPHGEEDVMFEGPFRLPWNHPALGNYLVGRLICWTFEANSANAIQVRILRLNKVLDEGYPSTPQRFLELYRDETQADQ